MREQSTGWVESTLVTWLAVIAVVTPRSVLDASLVPARCRGVVRLGKHVALLVPFCGRGHLPGHFGDEETLGAKGSLASVTALSGKEGSSMEPVRTARPRLPDQPGRLGTMWAS